MNYPFLAVSIPFHVFDNMMTPGQKRKYERSGDPYSLRRAKLPQTNTLKEIDDRPKIVPYHRQDNSKIFLTNLLYLVPLKDTMKMLVPFYWDPPADILDVTAGNRIIWENFPYNHDDLHSDGQVWHIDFADLSPESKCDIVADAKNIHKVIRKHYKILVCDFPFTEIKNGVESFGVRARKIHGRIKYKDKQQFRREFYFRYFVPPELIFPECVKAFNEVADSLIVKMGDFHKDKVLVPNVTFAELAFDKRFNPDSQFYLIDRVGYRGNYARRGGRFPFAQSVMSYYLIYKKRPDER